MKTLFEVHYKGHVLIEAESLRAANEEMEREHPEFETTEFYNCDRNESHMVIGHCEYSGLSIFEGDSYSYDTEGIMWLNETQDE